MSTANVLISLSVLFWPFMRKLSNQQSTIFITMIKFVVFIFSAPNLPFKVHNHCMVQISDRQFFFIGHDKSKRRNRYFTYDIKLEHWKEIVQKDSRNLPKSGSVTKQQCSAFEVDNRLKIFLSGYGYNTYVYDVISNTWQTGKYLIFYLLRFVNRVKAFPKKCRSM